MPSKVEFIESKIRRVAGDCNMKPKAIEGEVSKAAEYVITNEGKVRHAATKMSIRKMIEARRVLEPERFNGPSKEVMDSANPWTLGDTPGAHERRLEVIRTMGTRHASFLAAEAGTDFAARKLKVPMKCGACAESRNIFDLCSEAAGPMRKAEEAMKPKRKAQGRVI